MDSTRAKLAAKFQPFDLPAPLGDLADYWDENPVFFSGSFEVDHDEWDGVRRWFRENEAGWSRVRIFGHDGIDSLFGFWLYDDRTPADAPVIYLSGEGEGTTLLADTFADFLAILATNRDWEPFDGEFCDPEEENEEENAHFRRWLAARGIQPADDPYALLLKARERHPDLHAWLASVRPGWRA